MADDDDRNAGLRQASDIPQRGEGFPRGVLAFARNLGPRRSRERGEESGPLLLRLQAGGRERGVAIVAVKEVDEPGGVEGAGEAGMAGEACALRAHGRSSSVILE